MAVLVATALAPAHAGRASGASPTVLAQYDLVRADIASLGLGTSDVKPLLARLEVSRGAASAGNPMTAVHVLDPLVQELTDLGAPPVLLDHADTLRSMLLVESMFGPIPDLELHPLPFRIHQVFLEWVLSQVTIPAARGMADACGEAVSASTPPIAMLFGPPSPGGDGKLSDLEKRLVLDAGKKLLNDVKDSVTGGATSSTGQTTGGTTKGESKSGNTTVRPRCEVDNGVIANASASGGVTADTLKEATKSIGVSVSHTWTTGTGVSVRVTGTVDKTAPFSDDPGWRFGAGVGVSGDRFALDFAGTWDRHSGFGGGLFVSIGF